jgi:hypothetical protein
MNEQDAQGRTTALVRCRDERERARLLGEAWRDWEAFNAWADIQHPSECTFVFRKMPDEERERASALLSKLQAAVDAVPAIAEKLAKEQVEKLVATQRTATARAKKERGTAIELRKNLETALDELNRTGSVMSWGDESYVMVSRRVENWKKLQSRLNAAEAKASRLEQELRTERASKYVPLERKEETRTRTGRTQREWKRRFEKGLQLACSFCNKPQKDVGKIIAGPNVYICNECIGLCTDILIKERVPFPYTTNLPAADLMEHIEARLETDDEFSKGLVKTVLKHLE